MRRLIYIVVMLIVLAFAQCRMPGSSNRGIDTVAKVKKSNMKMGKGVSLINLIANPDQYDGRPIRVEGVLSVAFEGTAIFLNKEDEELGICENGIWIDISKEDIASQKFKAVNKKYVLLEGTFDASDKGHFDRYNGTITKLTRLVSLDIINK